MMEMEMEPAKESKSKGPDKWEIDCWAKTLVEAEEIKADPKKMALLKPLLEKKAKAMAKITSLAQLKEKSKMVSKDMEDEDED